MFRLYAESAVEQSCDTAGSHSPIAWPPGWPCRQGDEHDFRTRPRGWFSSLVHARHNQPGHHGWHTSLILAGIFELLVMLATIIAFQIPEGDQSLGGARFDRTAIQTALASRDLWVYGVSLLGGYGAYFTTSQLFTEYATLERHFASSSGGLLSALILLAGIPGSVLGGYWAHRSRNLRMFVVGPLIVVAALLVLIPVVPAGALWALGIGIGFFLIFGFAPWLTVPARVCNIEHQYVGTATGLMITLAAIGGFFIPIIFGHLVSHTSFDTGWVFLAIVSFVFALLGLAGRNPVAVSERAHLDTSMG